MEPDQMEKAQRLEIKEEIVKVLGQDHEEECVDEGEETKKCHDLASDEKLEASQEVTILNLLEEE